MSIETPPTTTRTQRSDWIGAALVAVIWCEYSILWLLDIQSFTAFLSMMATELVVTVVFLGWWFTRKTFTWGQRFLALAIMLIMGLLVGRMSAGAMRPQLVQFGLPIALTVCMV